jgi:hypothetical protein
VDITALKTNINTAFASEKADWLVFLGGGMHISRTNNPKEGSPGGILSLCSYSTEDAAYVMANMTLTAIEARGETQEDHQTAIALEKVPMYPSGVIHRFTRVFADDPNMSEEMLAADDFSGDSGFNNVRRRWRALMVAVNNTDTNVYILRTKIRFMFLAHPEPRQYMYDQQALNVEHGAFVAAAEQHSTTKGSQGQFVMGPPSFLEISSIAKGMKLGASAVGMLTGHTAIPQALNWTADALEKILKIKKALSRRR